MTEKTTKPQEKPNPDQQPMAEPLAAPADDKQADDSLVTIQVSPYAARLLEEMALGHNDTEKTVADEIDLLIEWSFLSDLLSDNINPEQLHQAKTYEDKIELAIALLRAMRGAEGYCYDVKFGPYVVYVPNEEVERIEAERDKRLERNMKKITDLLKKCHTAGKTTDKPQKT